VLLTGETPNYLDKNWSH